MPPTARPTATTPTTPPWWAPPGTPSLVVAGDPLAFKITTPADLERARSLVATAPVAPVSVTLDRPPALPRVGVGTDVHAFGGDGVLWLAGLEWPGEPALSGHSDGDAVAHAIVDALLAAGGPRRHRHALRHRPPRIRRRARRRVPRAHARASSARPAGASATSSVQVQANRPRFAARRAEAEAALSAALGGAPVVGLGDDDRRARLHRPRRGRGGVRGRARRSGVRRRTQSVRVMKTENGSSGVALERPAPHEPLALVEPLRRSELRRSSRSRARGSSSPVRRRRAMMWRRIARPTPAPRNRSSTRIDLSSPRCASSLLSAPIPGELVIDPRRPERDRRMPQPIDVEGMHALGRGGVVHSCEVRGDECACGVAGEVVDPDLDAWGSSSASVAWRSRPPITLPMRTAAGRAESASPTRAGRAPRPARRARRSRAPIGARRAP